MDKWLQIWDRRGDTQVNLNLRTLLKLDGYDTGAGKIKAEVWASYVRWIEDKLAMQSASSVFEIGCGAGALLYQLQNQKRELAGWDYADSLINVASRAMPLGDFSVKSASKLNELGQRYDFMLANSVFQYFPDEEYARGVVEAMVKQAKAAVGIFDIYDARRQQAMDKKKRQALGEEVYAERYKGLNHIYYDRQWFRDLAQAMGLVAEVFDQQRELAEVSAYRFNVIIRKAWLARRQ